MELTHTTAKSKHWLESWKRPHAKETYLSLQAPSVRENAQVAPTCYQYLLRNVVHKTSQNPYRTSRPALFSADRLHKGNISGTTGWLNSVSIASITYQECIQYILIWYILLLYTITIDIRIRYSHYNLFYLCFQRQNIRSHPRKKLFFRTFTDTTESCSTLLNRS